MLNKNTVRDILIKQGIYGSVVCLHSSFKSFGPAESGPRSVIDGFLDAGNTLLVPTFYYQSETFPLTENYEQNGIDYSEAVFQHSINFSGNRDEIERSMGIIPRTVLTYPNAIRSRHPMNSFAAIGPKAVDLMKNQGNLNVYSAYKNIYSHIKNAYILLAGVRLTSCTPIHYAEEAAGKRLFRRWAIQDNQTVEIEVGGCSDGFENLFPLVSGIEKKITIGECIARIYPFHQFIDSVSEVVRDNPAIARCGNPDCRRCMDMAMGGPKLC